MSLASRSIILAVALLLGAISVPQAQATLVGMPAYAGSYAHFDTFSGAGGTSGVPTFANMSPSATNNLLFSATLSEGMTAGSVTGGGDRIYNGVGAGDTAYDLTLSGTATGPINTLYLVIKNTPPGGTSTEPANEFFVIDLTTNIGGNPLNPVDPPIGTLLGTGDVATGLMHISQYSWTGLNLNSGDTFSFAITSPATGHVSLDGIYVSTVPEPGSIALGCTGVAALGLLLRRRLKKQMT